MKREINISLNIIGRNGRATRESESDLFCKEKLDVTNLVSRVQFSVNRWMKEILRSTHGSSWQHYFLS